MVQFERAVSSLLIMQVFLLKVLVGVRDRSSVGVSAGEEVKIQ